MRDTVHGSAVPLEELLREGGWVRRLARSLTGGHDVDDIVQETWLAALVRPPRRDGPVGAWLVRVLRGRVLERWRAEGRRERQHAQAGTCDGETAPSPEELLGRMQLERRVAQMVTELDEPFRQTVLLRYYEQLSSVEIGRRLGVPAGTVRWRLKEGLARLRGRLDEEHGGDRRAWMAALLPLTGGPAGDLVPRQMSGPRMIWAGAAVVLILSATPMGLRRMMATNVGTAASAAPTVASATMPPPAARPAGDGREDCPTVVARLRTEVATGESRAARIMDENLLRIGEVNQAAHAELSPLIEEALARSPSGLGHSLECRTWACQLTVLTRGGFGFEVITEDERIRSRVQHFKHDVEPEPTREALSGAPVGRMTLTFTLAQPAFYPLTEAAKQTETTCADERSALARRLVRLRAVEAGREEEQRFNRSPRAELRQVYQRSPGRCAVDGRDRAAPAAAGVARRRGVPSLCLPGGWAHRRTAEGAGAGGPRARVPRERRRGPDLHEHRDPGA